LGLDVVGRERVAAAGPWPAAHPSSNIRPAAACPPAVDLASAAPPQPRLSRGPFGIGRRQAMVDLTGFIAAAVVVVERDEVSARPTETGWIQWADPSRLVGRCEQRLPAPIAVGVVGGQLGLLSGSSGVDRWFEFDDGCRVRGGALEADSGD